MQIQGSNPADPAPNPEAVAQLRSPTPLQATAPAASLPHSGLGRNPSAQPSHKQLSSTCCVLVVALRAS